MKIILMYGRKGHYWFVKQCWLVNITVLYRVQVCEKYRFPPQRFKNWGPFVSPGFKNKIYKPKTREF